MNAGIGPKEVAVINEGLKQTGDMQDVTLLEDEDPEIHEIFEEELRKRGITCKMKNMVPWCTGEAGAEAVKVMFPDEHGNLPGQQGVPNEDGSFID